MAENCNHPKDCFAVNSADVLICKWCEEASALRNQLKAWETWGKDNGVIVNGGSPTISMARFGFLIVNGGEVSVVIDSALEDGVVTSG